MAKKLSTIILNQHKNNLQPGDKKIARTIINELDRAHNTFHDKFIANIKTETLSYILILNSYKSIENSQMSKADLDEFKECMNNLKNVDREYNDVVAENIYILNYQLFEEYIKNIFTTLFTHLPEFLPSGSEKEKNYFNKKFNVYFNEIFYNLDISLCKKNIIERRVKKIIQSNDMIDVLEKINTLFKININKALQNKSKGAKKSLFELMFVYGQNRNILVHNNGEINSIYIQNFKKRGFRPEYREKTKITKKINKLDDHGYALSDIALKILHITCIQIPRIINNRKAIKQKLA
ncbi:hypothetical protein KAJ89_01840 [Candidatus Parcubacteria bacterium]|nr:hypothetical protein [Candidatus Parcubacteria bacterium]